MLKKMLVVLVAALVACTPAPAANQSLVPSKAEVWIVEIDTGREIHMNIDVPARIEFFKPTKFTLGIYKNGSVCVYGNVDEVKEVRIARIGAHGWYQEIQFVVYPEEKWSWEALCGQLEGRQTQNLVVINVVNHPPNLPPQEGR